MKTMKRILEVLKYRNIETGFLYFYIHLNKVNWIEEPTIENWAYGEEPNKPSYKVDNELQAESFVDLIKYMMDACELVGLNNFN